MISRSLPDFKAPSSHIIPHSKPYLTAEDFTYIDEILSSRWVGHGKFVRALEQAFEERFGFRHAVAVSHGTAALHLALLSLHIKSDDEVIVPSYVCASLLSAIHYTGATPVLVDIDLDTLNPTREMIQAVSSRRTKAIILTHTFGFPADLEPILNLGIPVIEDCAQALGASYHGKAVGSWGRLSIFSFSATKMICSGEGGMICANDDRLGSELRDLNHLDGQDSYRVRFNYKMSDLTAGLAFNQFRRLDSFIERRREIVRRYQAALSGTSVRIQRALENSEPVFFRFVLRSPCASQIIHRALESEIIFRRPVHRPLHHYLATGSAYPNTDRVWNEAVSVPIYPDLTDAEVSRIESALLHCFRSYHKLNSALA